MKVGDSYKKFVWKLQKYKMEGKYLLNSLPSDIKEKIAAKFGSIDDFYNLVFRLSNDYYKSFMAKDKERVNRLESIRFKIAHELESMGVIDGLEVYDAISADHDEAIIMSKYPPITHEQIDLLNSLE